MSGIPILGRRAAQPLVVEVCRSFSRKLNLANYGGQQYESADFFASRKVECAAEDVASISAQIYEECVVEVREAMAAYIEEMRTKQKMRAKRPVSNPVAESNSRAYEAWKEKTA